MNNNNNNSVNKNLKYFNNFPMKSPFYPTKCIDCGINNRFICSECINYDFSLCRNCHQAFIHGGFNNNNNINNNNNNNNNNMNCSNTSCNTNCENNNHNQKINNNNCNNSFIGSPNASSCSTSYDNEEFDYQDLAIDDFDHHHHFYQNQFYYDYQFDNSQFDFKCFISNKLFTCPYLNCLKEGFNEQSLSLHLLECHEEENLLNTYVVCPFCSYRYKDGKFVEHIKENHLDNHIQHNEINNNETTNNNITDNLVS